MNLQLPQAPSNLPPVRAPSGRHRNAGVPAPLPGQLGPSRDRDLPSGGGLKFNGEEDAAQKRITAQQQYENDLKQQMEEQRARKAAEQLRKREEEALEEERLQRERQELEDRFKAENDKKQQKVEAARAANAQLMKEKESRQQAQPPPSQGRKLDLPTENRGDDIFGPGPQL